MESKNLLVTVAIKYTDENDKQKKITENHLVDAVSFTEAEAKMTKYFEGDTREWEIKSIKDPKIINIIK